MIYLMGAVLLMLVLIFALALQISLTLGRMEGVFIKILQNFKVFQSKLWTRNRAGS